MLKKDKFEFGVQKLFAVSSFSVTCYKQKPLHTHRDAILLKPLCVRCLSCFQLSAFFPAENARRSSQNAELGALESAVDAQCFFS